MAEATKTGGLRNVVAGQSALSSIDGARGLLAYRGIDIHDLAEHSSFEEVVFLLHRGSLPKVAQLEALRQELARERAVPEGVVALLRGLPPSSHPMAALRTLVSALGAFDPDGESDDEPARTRKAARLTAQMATLVALIERHRRGQPPVLPDAALSHAANFLYMLSGRKPKAVNVRAFDAALVLYAEHELNASTFTARVIASTLADMHSAVSGAIGALKGPLHGGAGEAVMRTLEEIGAPDRAEAFTQKALAEKRRLMGFGHRVYKAGDPRARILRALAAKACRQSGQGVWFDTAVALHEAVNRAKGLIPNVDFYSAPLFAALGIPVDLFVPVIAVSRIAGWTAHLLEQYADNRLIRPRAEYVGPPRRPFRTLAERV